MAVAKKAAKKTAKNKIASKGATQAKPVIKSLTNGVSRLVIQSPYDGDLLVDLELETTSDGTSYINNADTSGHLFKKGDSVIDNVCDVGWEWFLFGTDEQIEKTIEFILKVREATKEHLKRTK